MTDEEWSSFAGTLRTAMENGSEERAVELVRKHCVKAEAEKSAFPFDEFWNCYNKKVDRMKCERVYAKIPESERLLIREKLPKYIIQTPYKPYRKNPLTWLHGKCWNDEEVGTMPDREKGF